jgi:hypothetical protein
MPPIRNPLVARSTRPRLRQRPELLLVEAAPACWLGDPASPAYNEFRSLRSTAPARGSTTSCRLRRNGMGSETAGPQLDAATRPGPLGSRTMVDSPGTRSSRSGCGLIDLLALDVRPALAHATA